jgi:hypothetical protein
MLELHIQETPQSGFGKMLWSHPMLEGVGPGELEIQGLDGFLWVPFAKPCWHCGEPTCWIDLAFETNLCPGRCSEKKYDEYEWQRLLSWLQGEEGQQWIFENFGEPPRG